MTRNRIYGEDTPFGKWMRSQGRIDGTMPSTAFVSSDCDFIIHRYKTVVDSYGTREVQAQMLLEVKTNGARPGFSQVDSMWLTHLCANTSSPRRRVLDSDRLIIHHGVSFLSLSGTTPDNSKTMEWGRFRRAAAIEWREISADNLIDLMMFDIHPDNFERNPYRRHHRTKHLEQVVAFPIGFSAPVTITKRS
jgi:hypothetical protein